MKKHVVQGFVFGLLVACSIIMPSRAEAYSGSSGCYVFSDFADTKPDPAVIGSYAYMVDGDEIVSDGMLYYVVFDAFLGFNSWTPSNVSYGYDWPADPNISTNGNDEIWTGNPAEWETYCRTNLVSTPSASGPSTFMPVASSSGMVNDIMDRYGWELFSAVAGFFGMLFLVRIVLFAYDRLKNRLDGSKKSTDIV